MAADAKCAELLGALKRLTAACIEDFGEPGEWFDDDAVGGGTDGDMAITFGHIRQALAAIAKAEA